MQAGLGPRFDEALVYAHEAHRAQTRRGGDVPYVAHLLGVAALVIEDGGDEDEAIAALLHDAAEDAGGRKRLDDIRARFGDRVAGIVAACTDTYDDPKPPWRARKAAYIDHLRTETDPGVLRVSLADKLHNARAILRDFREVGDELWKRFNPGADPRWYYETLVEVFRAKVPRAPMLRELEETFAALAREAWAESR